VTAPVLMQSDIRGGQAGVFNTDRVTLIHLFGDWCCSVDIDGILVFVGQHSDEQQHYSVLFSIH